MPKHNFLQLSWIQVLLTSSASTMLPRLDPKIKVISLRYTGWQSYYYVCHGVYLQKKKRLVMTSPRQLVNILNVRVWGQSNWPFRTNRVRLKRHLLPLPSASKPSKNHGDKTEKNIKHSENTTFNETVNIIPENFLEALKRSCGLPRLWAAMLMAVTLKIDDINRGTVECPKVKKYKGKYLNKGLTTRKKVQKIKKFILILYVYVKWDKNLQVSKQWGYESNQSY